jgi:hypothetical protein
MPRRVYLLGLGLALAALAFTDWALSFQHGVTDANVRRIRPGMSLKEVKRIFGHAANFELASPVGDLFARPWYRKWYGNGGEARLVFDAHYRVISAKFERTTENSGLLARLRAWLGF